MTTEEAIEQFLNDPSNHEHMPTSEADQVLLEELGDEPVPGLLSLL